MNIMVVLNYNDADTTIEYLETVKTYSVIDKIIVVDNCSTDDSYGRIEQLKSEKIDVILSNGNYGYAAGNNYGISYAMRLYNPDYIIISNPDIEVSEKTVQHLIDFLKRKEKAAVATGLIYNKGAIVQNFAWRLPDFGAVLRGNSGIMHTIYERKSGKSMYYSLEEANEDGSLEVEVVPGCYFVMRSSIWKEIGGFDERTFLFWEENILGYILREKGQKLYVLTNDPVVHKESISIKKNVKGFCKKRKINYKSEQIYVRYYLKKGICKRILHHFVYWYGMIEGLLYVQYSDWKRKRGKKS